MVLFPCERAKGYKGDSPGKDIKRDVSQGSPATVQVD